jgi:CIC family chloride channel protein
MRALGYNFDWELTGRWMRYSAVVGAAGAHCVVVFSELVVLVTDVALTGLAGYPVPRPGDYGALRCFRATPSARAAVPLHQTRVSC